MTYFIFILTNFRFLLLTILMTGFSSFGQTFYISLFGGEIRSFYGLTSGQFGGYYSVATLASGFTILWLGSVVDRYDLKKIVVVVISLLAISCLMMGLSTHWIGLILSFYLLRLFGQGFMTHTAMTATGRYFDANRGKAISVTESGFPVGQSVLPILTVWLIGFIGWRETWISSAIFLLVFFLPLALWLLKGQQQRHLDYLQSQQQAVAASGDTAGTTNWTRKQILSDSRFYIILPMLLSAPFILTGLFFHQVHLAMEKNWTLALMATGLIAFSITQIAGNLIAGGLIDKFSSRKLYGWSALPLIFGLLIFSMGNGTENLVIYLLLAGLTAGMGGTFGNAIWPEMYGTKHLGAIRSMAGFIMIVATALSPAFFGWLIDQSVSMNQIALFSAGYTLLSLLVIQIARKFHYF